MDTANLIALLALLGMVVAAYVIIKMDGIGYKKDIEYLKCSNEKLERRDEEMSKEIQEIRIILAENGIKISTEKK